ncbi:gluconokinase [Metapseudomonas resinovorans]|uniref:Gluconokinase n=1 Tax=Metapseudomonas resinovorans NBRC 106553 TaxID=1245471 RepID=S6AI75_METRE|nr:gluconokinase [Pseudomonas resinovorans]BAN48010.1 gluconokinase [Pseudomonas resinovorans NBRC 106553]
MYEPINAVVIMGVAGSGKSAVARALEVRTGARLIEGDAFHPDRNIKKMSAGQPLSDKDRAGWLHALEKQLKRAYDAGERPILTCSALKRDYRDGLRHALPGLGFAYLQLSPEAAAERMAQRRGHFMPTSLLDSQFADLEEPLDEPFTLVLDGKLSVGELASAIHQWWQQHAPA